MNDTEKMAGPETTGTKPAQEAKSQGSDGATTQTENGAGELRLNQPDREQTIPAMQLDQLLEPEHLARKVWLFVLTLDLALLYACIHSFVGGSGRPAIDPRILVTLWLYATLSGVVSARRIADLCLRHNAYRWICGGVSVNYHTLSDFRVVHADFLEQSLTKTIEVLRQQGLVTLEFVTQDGMRVRASAGAASFHCKATLERQLKEAQDELAQLKAKLGLETKPKEETVGPADTIPALDKSQQQQQQEVAPAASPKVPVVPEEKPELTRQEAAEVRSAEERMQRAEQALELLPEVEKHKTDPNKEARVSSTDPEATVMRMPDGGYRPAYNIQYSTDCKSGTIVGVAVEVVGSDKQQLRPMLDQVEERLGKRPENALVDAGYVSFDELEKIQNPGEGKAATLVYMPVPGKREDRYTPKEDDKPTVAAWRIRMGTEAAKEIYSRRGQIAELVNAHAHNCGLVSLLVRGVSKVKAVATWVAVALNLQRIFAFAPRSPPLPCPSP